MLQDPCHEVYYINCSQVVLLAKGFGLYPRPCSSLGCMVSTCSAALAVLTYMHVLQLWVNYYACCIYHICRIINRTGL